VGGYIIESLCDGVCAMCVKVFLRTVFSRVHHEWISSYAL
jgi:hypothetical protein